MDDRTRWDAKYSGKEGRALRPPDPFVLRALDRLGPPDGGRALDLASGAGRHALELAGRGWEVEAWDVSPVGLALLEDRARAAGVEIRTRAVDVLADGAWEAFGPGARFDLVVCVDFLDHGLWARLPRLVTVGEHVILRTFTRNWSGPKPPERFRLEPGELAGGLVGFETLLVEEGDGRAGLLARRSP